MYVCSAAVSSKGLSPVFLASSVCSNSSLPMLTCDQQSTLQHCACCPSEMSSDLLHNGLDLLQKLCCIRTPAKAEMANCYCCAVPHMFKDLQDSQDLQTRTGQRIHRDSELEWVWEQLQVVLIGLQGEGY